VHAPRCEQCTHRRQDCTPRGQCALCSNHVQSEVDIQPDISHQSSSQVALSSMGKLEFLLLKGAALCRTEQHLRRAAKPCNSHASDCALVFRAWLWGLPATSGALLPQLVVWTLPMRRGLLCLCARRRLQKMKRQSQGPRLAWFGACAQLGCALRVCRVCTSACACCGGHADCCFAQP